LTSSTGDPISSSGSRTSRWRWRASTNFSSGIAEATLSTNPASLATSRRRPCAHLQVHLLPSGHTATTSIHTTRSVSPGMNLPQFTARSRVHTHLTLPVYLVFSWNTIIPNEPMRDTGRSGGGCLPQISFPRFDGSHPQLWRV
jgi:hypothetical protein